MLCPWLVGGSWVIQNPVHAHVLPDLLMTPRQDEQVYVQQQVKEHVFELRFCESSNAAAF